MVQDQANDIIGKAPTQYPLWHRLVFESPQQRRLVKADLLTSFNFLMYLFTLPLRE